jgi:hypothetical protein
VESVWKDPAAGGSVKIARPPTISLPPFTLMPPGIETSLLMRTPFTERLSQGTPANRTR